MIASRRRFVRALAGSAAGLASAATLPRAEAHAFAGSDRLASRIVELFGTLPGQHALHIASPGPHYSFEAASNADAALFCGSAFKAFVLAEFLRMVDAGEATLTELLPVDASVWSVSSPVLTPWPGAVTGQVNARTALDAMISRSDNTATDMLQRRVGADRVRRFISDVGLSNARIPDSTRQFFAYISGDPQWQTVTWERLLVLVESDAFPTRPVLNDVQTMAVSPRDFVSFYARALQGAFFADPATLTTFRAVLAQSEAIPRAMPLGVNAFVKGGSIDFDGEYALCLAGGVFIPARRWVYFGMTINWTDAEGGNLAQEAPRFGSVVMQIFTLLRDRLGTC